MKGQAAAERSGILALEWCAEFFQSCQLAAEFVQCADQATGSRDYDILLGTDVSIHQQIKSLQDVLSARKPLCGAKYSAIMC